jgi:hypothetical protein
MDEWWIGRDQVGSNLGLIEVISRYLPGGLWKTTITRVSLVGILTWSIKILTLPINNLHGVTSQKTTVFIRERFKYHHQQQQQQQKSLFEPQPSLQDSVRLYPVFTSLEFARIIILQRKAVSSLSNPQPGGPGLWICFPQWQGDPVIPPCTGSSFRRLVLIAGIRWR